MLSQEGGFVPSCFFFIKTILGRVICSFLQTIPLSTSGQHIFAE
jgi:hypothetical protein